MEGESKQQINKKYTNSEILRIANLNLVIVRVFLNIQHNFKSFLK